MRVPAGIALRMLSGDAAGGTVRASKDNRAPHLAAGHIQRLGGRVDDLVDGLHGEIERHEFDHRPQIAKGGPDPETGKALLGDRRVDDPLGTEFGKQALGHLVGTLIFGHFLAHDKDTVIGAHFLGHRITQCFADRDFDSIAAGHRLGSHSLCSRCSRRGRRCLCRRRRHLGDRRRRRRGRCNRVRALALFQQHGDG